MNFYKTCFETTQEAPVSCAAITDKQKELINFAQPILSTPKPKPKQEEKKGRTQNSIGLEFYP